jgi:plasmid stability protein
MEKYVVASMIRLMTKDKNYPSRVADQFVVRLPDGMRDKIAEEAKKNNRSMNAEIVGRLEASLSPSADTPMNLEHVFTHLNYKLADLEADKALLRLHLHELAAAIKILLGLIPEEVKIHPESAGLIDEIRQDAELEELKGANLFEEAGRAMVKFNRALDRIKKLSPAVPLENEEGKTATTTSPPTARRVRRKPPEKK